MSVEYWEMIAQLFGTPSDDEAKYEAAQLYSLLTNQPTTTVNDDGTFTYSFTRDDRIQIKPNPLVPEGRLLAYEPIIAHADGRTFSTMPPSAVMALQKMRDE